MEKASALTTNSELNFTTSLARKLVLSALSTLEHGQLTLIENGQTHKFGKTNSPKVTLTVTDNTMFKQFATGGSIGAGEAYIDGHWYCDDLTALIEIFVLNQAQLDKVEGRFGFLSHFANKLFHKKNKNSVAGSKRNILAHYDLGNDLYTSFLDKEMMYSCAIYPEKSASLEQAQLHKLKTICDGLELKPTDHLIEIGTGWGGLAIYAAQHYGCKVTTTTISDAQHDYAKARIEALGLASQITLLKQDYRLLEGEYDKLVSIEMIEAVGHEFLPTFFAKCSSLLKPHGKMLIQAITIADQRYNAYLKQPDFIQKYIFPGGCLPSIEQMQRHIANQTDCVIHKVEDIGMHYARTLYDWRVRFFEAFPRLDKSKFSENFKRLWEFYLCYCEGAFKQRAISTVHLVARKPRYRGDKDAIPLHY